MTHEVKDVPRTLADRLLKGAPGVPLDPVESDVSSARQVLDGLCDELLLSRHIELAMIADHAQNADGYFDLERLFGERQLQVAHDRNLGGQPQMLPEKTRVVEVFPGERGQLGRVDSQAQTQAFALLPDLVQTGQVAGVDLFPQERFEESLAEVLGRLDSLDGRFSFDRAATVRLVGGASVLDGVEKVSHA